MHRLWAHESVPLWNPAMSVGQSRFLGWVSSSFIDVPIEIDAFAEVTADSRGSCPQGSAVECGSSGWGRTR